MRIDRKQFLAQLVAAPALIAAFKVDDDDDKTAARRRSAGAETVEQRVERILREYDAQGIHRTGTDVDERCARWLAEEARRLGAESELESMPFSRIDVVECFVEVGGKRIEGVPLFDAPFTGPAGRDRNADAGRTGAAGEIGFWLDAVPDAAGGKKFIEHRRTTAQSALVAVTGGEKWRLVAGPRSAQRRELRASRSARRWCRSRARPARWSRAPPARTVRVVSHAVRKDVQAYNTLATIPGRDPSLAPLGVMTPRSGWWQCASERGGGIAVWLEILAAVAAAKPARTVNFVASTGHELGHYGLSHYLASRRELIAGTRAWIHLGANFTTSILPQVRMQFSDAEMRSLALDALARHGLAPDVETPLGQTPIGEARNVADGGRYISITGFNGRFHQAARPLPRSRRSAARRSPSPRPTPRSR